MLPELFWDLSLAEIVDMIESYNRKLKQSEKRKIEQLFLIADAVISRVALLFPKDQEMPEPLQPWDVYPELFAEEKEDAAASEEQRQLEAYKAQMRKRASAVNRIMGEMKHG